MIRLPESMQDLNDLMKDQFIQEQVLENLRNVKDLDLSDFKIPTLKSTKEEWDQFLNSENYNILLLLFLEYYLKQEKVRSGIETKLKGDTDLRVGYENKFEYTTNDFFNNPSHVKPPLLLKIDVPLNFVLNPDRHQESYRFLENLIQNLTTIGLEIEKYSGGGRVIYTVKIPPDMMLARYLPFFIDACMKNETLTPQHDLMRLYHREKELRGGKLEKTSEKSDAQKPVQFVSSSSHSSGSSGPSQPSNQDAIAKIMAEKIFNISNMLLGDQALAPVGPNTTKSDATLKQFVIIYNQNSKYPNWTSVLEHMIKSDSLLQKKPKKQERKAQSKPFLSSLFASFLPNLSPASAENPLPILATDRLGKESLSQKLFDIIASNSTHEEKLKQLTHLENEVQQMKLPPSRPLLK